MKRYVRSATDDSRVQKLTPEEFADNYGYDVDSDEGISIVFFDQDPAYMDYIYDAGVEDMYGFESDGEYYIVFGGRGGCQSCDSYDDMIATLIGEDDEEYEVDPEAQKNYRAQVEYEEKLRRDKLNEIRSQFKVSNGAAIIPAGATSIPKDAFKGCSDLKTVVIPDSVTSIENCAFSDCASLTSVTIPNSVTSIGFAAFEFCTSLKEIIIPDSVTSISNWAFAYCSSLENIEIPNSVTSIGAAAFRNCEKFTAVTIPSSVKYLGETAFGYCPNLENVTINDGVEGIDHYTFYGCSITTITIPGSVRVVGMSAFGDCSNLETVILGDGVERIGAYAFDGCRNLNSIVIPDSVRDIGGHSGLLRCDDLVIYTTPNSYADEYAQLNDIKVEYIENDIVTL